jgi:cardiolipin synthase
LPAGGCAFLFSASAILGFRFVGGRSSFYKAVVTGGVDFQWLPTGAAGLEAMREAIESASRSVRLETYIFADDRVGRSFLEALLAAQARGVRTQVMIDAVGSLELPDSFWTRLRQAGGEVRWFNPISLKRWSYRDHRKILVCDDQVGFIGGINIAAEYDGDGVEKGWRDLGLRVTGPAVAELAEAFDDLFAKAGSAHRRLQRLRRASNEVVAGREWRLLLSGPGRQRGQLRRSLAGDLAGAQSVQIQCAYFLPTWRLRRALMRVCRRGGRVQLILAGRSDVRLSQLASRRLYQTLLRAGVEISEYLPQVLHAKLFIVDHVVYAGSANLDARSLRINYELLLRIEQPSMAAAAQEIFSSDLARCQRIDPVTWKESRSFLTKLWEKWAYLLLARLDPFLARRSLQGQP